MEDERAWTICIAPTLGESVMKQTALALAEQFGITPEEAQDILDFDQAWMDRKRAEREQDDTEAESARARMRHR